MADKLNQDIVKALVRADDSASGLSKKLNKPVATVWRRLKLLSKTGIVVQSGTKHVGNMEMHFYRASAAMFIPPQPLDFSPTEARVREALLLYSKMQSEILANIAKHNDIPADIDPYDYSVFIDIFNFADYFSNDDTPAKAVEIKRILLKSLYAKFL